MSEEINHSVRAHAILSASGADRWMNCTPSARLEEKFPNDSSEYAKEGTLAHELAELNLRYQLKLISKTEYNKAYKEIQKSEYYAEDMDDYVQIHVDYVIQQYKASDKKTKGKSTLLIEERVDLSDYIEEGSGTCDDIVIADRVLEVIDLKYGKGLRVSAEENSQLKLYGLGAYNAFGLLYDIDTVKLTIVQPRLDSISSFDISVDDLLKWAEDEVKPKAELAFSGQGDQQTGNWCRFCRAKSRCKKLADENMELAKLDFADPELLSDDELMQIYAVSGRLSDWANGLHDYIFKEALNGKKWPGLKLVEGRSNRTWKDQEAVQKKLSELKFKKDDFMISKLAGIGAIEKLIGKKQFEPVLGELIIKPPGKPTLTSESDKRPEYGINQAIEDFSEEL